MSHLGDTNKMVSDTPRMKAAVMAAMEHGTGNVYRVGCDIERELNAANQRIKRLEEAGDEMERWIRRWMKSPIKCADDWRKAKEDKL